jgi:hypothetical protein
MCDKELHLDLLLIFYRNCKGMCDKELKELFIGLLKQKPDV